MEVLTETLRSRRIIDEYAFEVNANSGLVLSAGSKRIVNIKFVNGAVVDVQNDVEPIYINTPDYWKLMKAVADKVEELSKTYK